jgi:hypothetical protein
MTPILPGRYRHYKGAEYEVLGIARHSETEEEYVLYRPLYGNRDLWIRPAAMFAESVIVGGRARPRFELIARHPAPLFSPPPETGDGIR